MIDRIKAIIEPVISEEGIELVEIIYRREAGRQVLRLLVDRKGGINLSDCIRLNEQISRILDENDVIPKSYVLEVDSPGIDRPFQTKKDYLRALGRMVRITLSEAVIDKKEYIGRLEDVLEDSVKINVKKKGIIDISFEKILRARQEIEF